jgi:hypothetical protein
MSASKVDDLQRRLASFSIWPDEQGNLRTDLEVKSVVRESLKE